MINLDLFLLTGLCFNRNNSCPWELIIYDEDGFDFTKGLLLAGLAKKPDSNDDDMEDETSAVVAA